MTRKRIPAWESRSALAVYLWERGEIKAQFAGQMAHMLAKALDRVTDRSTPWTDHNALGILRSLEEDGYVTIDGVTKITKIKWIGSDPAGIEWQPPKPESKPRSASTADIEHRLVELQAQIDRIPTLVRQAVDIAMKEWINKP